MCVYVYVYKYMLVCVRVSKYVWVSVFLSFYIYAYVCLCILRVCVNTFMYVLHIRTCVVFMCAYVCASVFFFIYRILG